MQTIPFGPPSLDQPFDLSGLIDDVLAQLPSSSDKEDGKTCLVIEGVDEWLYFGASLLDILTQLRRFRSALRQV